MNRGESPAWNGYSSKGENRFFFIHLCLKVLDLHGDMGFKVGIVTNAYGAVSEDDAHVWFRPLADLGVSFLNISDDPFHYGEENSPAKYGLKAAQKLGIPTAPIHIQKPFVEAMPGQGMDKGAPVIGGGAMFRGRAVEKLTAGLPCRPSGELVQCPYKDLRTLSNTMLTLTGRILMNAACAI